MDASEKVSGGLFISGGDSAKFLELAHEILDEMACFVQLFVERAWGLAIALGRDHRGFARRQKGFNYPLIGVEGFIGQLAPALCWWARTIVLSIMAYSLSESAARTSNIFFQTPVLAQRENRVWILIGSPNRSGRSRQGIPARYR